MGNQVKILKGGTRQNFRCFVEENGISLDFKVVGFVVNSANNKLKNEALFQLLSDDVIRKVKYLYIFVFFHVLNVLFFLRAKINRL